MEELRRRVYTVPEVAQMLGISKSYCYELVKKKEIPTMTLGTRRIIPKDKFDKWLNDAE